tara:strand:+ start:21417 stop:22139 length:723 start_codon:yes stop_codon:yes gene_type:complete
MTLALTLDAEKHSALDSALQPFYVKQDDGNYRLDADIPDSSGLKAKADELLGETKRERELRKAAEDRAKALEDERQKALDDNARAKGDVESLEKSYQERIAKLNEDSTGKVSTLQKQIYDLTVGQAANNLANELSIKGSAKALLPHIQNRLTLTEDENGKQVVKVLDANGGKTLMTIEDLKQEFRSDEAFKPLIAANGASGSGANGANGGAGQITKADMSEAERIELAKTNPELFRKLFT